MISALLAFGFSAAQAASEDPAPAAAPPSASAPEAAASAALSAPARSGVSRPLWELGVGVAGLSLPDYRGSDRTRSHLLPLPYAIYRGQWLRADRDGARALLVDSSRVEVDVSVGATVPARSDDNGARAGMPDLPGTLEIGPNANFRLFNSTDRSVRLDLRLPVRAAMTLERNPRGVGGTFSPNLNLDIAGLGGGWNLGLLTGPLFGDRRYHAFLYDVDPAYATAERPAYRSRGGYEGWRALAATSRRFSDMWVGAFVRYDSLRGSVIADSPLVRRTDNLTIGFGVAWVLATSSERVWVAD